MKKLLVLYALTLLSPLAQAQTYTGPRVTSSNTFAVNDVQPEGVYCLVNGDRRVEGEIISASTNAVLTAMPLRVPTKTRCRADTFKHGDTILMLTTRRDRPQVGQSAPYIYTMGSLYGCRPYQDYLVCNVVPKALPIEAVPPVVTSPVVVPPVVTPPVTTYTWEYGAATHGSFTLSAAGVVRYGVDDKWVEVSLAAGTYACEDSLFPSDPAPGVGKRCFVRKP